MRKKNSINWLDGALKRARLAALLPAVAAVGVIKSAPVFAIPATWDGNANVGVVGDGANWSNADNWTTNGVVDSAPTNTAPGDDLTFGLGTVGQIQLQADRVANSLTFNAGFTLIGAADTLTIATGDVTIDPSVSTAIDAEIAGSSGLTKLGAGTLNLYDSDQYTGGTTISAGTLVVLSASALAGTTTVAPAGALVFNSSQTLSASVASSGAVSIDSGATVSLTGTSTSYTQSAGSLSAAGELLLTAGTFNYNGGSISGTVTLNNDSSFDAPTVNFNTAAVSTGTFQFIGALANVNGSVPSGVTVQFQPSPASYSGGEISFNTSNATNSGSLQLIGAPSTTETFFVAGTCTNNGVIAYSAVGSPSSSPDYLVGDLDNAGTLSIGAPVIAQGSVANTGSISIGAKQSLGMPGYALYQNAGSVSVASGATLNLSTAFLYINGGTINLSADPVSPARLTLYDLLFDSTSGTGTIASGPVGPGEAPGYVDLGGTTVFFEIMHGSAADDVVISAPITDGSIQKMDTGTLLISGRNTFSAATVSDGELVIGAAGALPAGANVTIGSIGTLQLDPGIGGQSLSSLAINTGGQFDISNNHMVISYSSSDPISTIAGYIKTGFNGGAWNGPGIISSAAQTKTNGLSYGVGWADGKDKAVSGLSSGQIEVKYTLLGDANLDGVVNGSDFSILAANFGQGVTNWDQGDFVFTPAVNGSDFSALAANFGQGDSGADAEVSAADWGALNAFAAANGLLADVPEPAPFGLLAVAGAAVVARRRFARRLG